MNFYGIILFPSQDISALGIVDLLGYTIETAPEIKKKKLVVIAVCSVMVNKNGGWPDFPLYARVLSVVSMAMESL